VKRHAFNDCWRHIEQRTPSSGPTEITVTNLDGLDDFTEPFKGAITALCGFNGAGKTTVLRCIHEALKGDGRLVPDRITRAMVSISVLRRGTITQLEKASGQPFKQIPEISADVISIDPANEIPRLQAFFRSVSNIDEELRQHEPILLDSGERDLLNYLVGREYESVSIIDLNDDYADGDIATTEAKTPVAELVDNEALMYFTVRNAGVEYSVESMGLGELSLIYLFWRLHRARKNSIILIEEPESFIATASQLAMIDVIAHYVDTKNLWVCMSTHSEHILARIPEKDIFALTREANGKHTVRRSVRREQHLAQLRLLPRTEGYVFCEDWVGVHFARRLLELEGSPIGSTFQFLPLFGDSKIERMLQTYPKGRSVLPILSLFDGDVRSKADFPKSPAWPFTYLPGERPPEELLICHAREHAAEVDSLLHVEPGTTSRLLGSLVGFDFHDQLSDFSTQADRPISWIISAFTSAWHKDETNQAATTELVDQLTKFCEGV
jgi:predicted ATPase